MTKFESHLCDYEKACNTLLHDFLRKHEWEIPDGWWVSEKIGETWCIDGESMMANMTDIVSDIRENAPKKAYEEWWEYCIRCYNLGINSTPNYTSWLHGCPRHSDESLRNLEKLKSDFDFLIMKINKEQF